MRFWGRMRHCFRWSNLQRDMGRQEENWSKG